MTSGWVTLKKPFTETSMTRCHCSARMPGKTASSWMPALLTTIWIAPPSSRRSQAARAASRVGDVEGDRLGAAAGGDDPRDDGVGAVEAGVGVRDHVRAVAAEPLGDRLADAAAGAGDEGAPARRRRAASSRVRQRRRRGRRRRVPRRARGRRGARRTRRGCAPRRRPGARRRRRARRDRRAAGRRGASRRGARRARWPGSRARRGRRRRRPQSAPCTAIACAAYSIAALASRPLALRSGWRGSRWLTATHSIRVASHDVMRSSRHIGPRCGISASMPAWSSAGGRHRLAPRRGRRTLDGGDEQHVRERRAAVHRLARDREAELGEARLPRRRASGRSWRPKPWPRASVTKRSTHWLAAKPRRAAASPMRSTQPAADRQRGAHAREHRVLLGDARRSAARRG